MLFFSEGFTFRNFLADAFAVFMFVLWFWLLIIVIGDLFRRHDISGWIKAIWVIALIVFPYLGIFAYLITPPARRSTLVEVGETIRAGMAAFARVSGDTPLGLIRSREASTHSNGRGDSP